MDKRTKAMLFGVGSLLNLGGKSMLRIQTSRFADALALKNDWEHISSIHQGVDNAGK